MEAAGSIEAARAHDAAGRPEAAIAAAWDAFDAAPDDLEARRLIATLLEAQPDRSPPARADSLHALVTDPKVDPGFVGAAGWSALVRAGALSAAPPQLAEALESDAFALALLRETYVARLDAEIPLTALRRWLLLSGEAPRFPRLVAALAAQAAHNGGAWLIEPDEDAALARGSAIAAAYLPPRRVAEGSGHADPVTRAVADQYRGWPYPSWSRVMRTHARPLAEIVARLDPERPATIPAAPEILIAGCGTGREAAQWAQRDPASRVLAIDLSPTSLAYAAERCAAMGLANVAFAQCDLHDVASLGRRFDAIVCSGVLHHLPNPEAGWQALAGVLRPGGVMRVMVYSKLARLPVRAARTLIADLIAQPVDDALLRAVRRRLIEKGAARITASRDFFTLGGVHDLLLHRHEDAFDVPRIAAALDRLGLELLAFELPSRAAAARYRARFPHDPLFRDVAAWARTEKDDPMLFARMYGLWCRAGGSA